MKIKISDLKILNFQNDSMLFKIENDLLHKPFVRVVKEEDKDLKILRVSFLSNSSCSILEQECFITRNGRNFYANIKIHQANKTNTESQIQLVQFNIKESRNKYLSLFFKKIVFSRIFNVSRYLEIIIDDQNVAKSLKRKNTMKISNDRNGGSFDPPPLHGYN
ncbi:hypothetical protein [Polaribacter cellanae]|uniref:Uncharacterized protein n=1 Tax=Polaribacter cellanae TaxID=2818493 RepID=A0A975CPG0_9FLAO|nr:hypothetical protein [Polaribacter cellanae]QTE23074.1 hypothetical protein J3359_02015 [Polaribacter cellanae]